MAQHLPFAHGGSCWREAASIRTWFNFVNQNDEGKVYNRRRTRA